MTLDEFVNKYNNKGIDVDGFPKDNPYQCVDLYRQYVKECLDFPQSPSVAGAKDIWDTYLTSYFTRYNNSPTAVPKKGDIILWGTKLGQYGHVAIFLDGGVTKFNSFDQNYPEGSLCHIQSHTYTGVLGWLRPKEQQLVENVPQWLKTLLQERGLNLNSESEIRIIFDKAKRYDDEINELQEKVKSSNESLSDKSLEVSTLTGKLQTIQNRVDELEKLYSDVKNDRDSLLWNNDKLKLQIEELKKGVSDRDSQITQLKLDYTTLKEQSTMALSVWELIQLIFKKKVK